MRCQICSKEECICGLQATIDALARSRECSEDNLIIIQGKKGTGMNNTSISNPISDSKKNKERKQGGLK